MVLDLGGSGQGIGALEEGLPSRAAVTLTEGVHCQSSNPVGWAGGGKYTDLSFPSFDH